MSTPEVALVVAWHEALNAGDTDRISSLSSDDVDVGGPRGVGRGADLLRDWVARADIYLEPGRIFQRADTIVVEQSAQWRSENGQLTEPQVVASVFRIQEGRVASVIRHPDVSAAMEAAGLAESDEQPRRG